MIAAEGAAPLTLFRWDLDKTYLRSEFETLRDLIRVPFERGEDKVDVPGVVELIRSLKEAARARGQEARVLFLSASPPQIAQAILDKFAIDGIEVDGIVFKDQLQILMRGRFRGLREQTGFKLAELLRGRLSAPDGAPEYLFGDDWETDPIIYSLYGDLMSGRVDAAQLSRVLDEIRVEPRWRLEIEDLLGRVVRSDSVRRIFINLERGRPPRTFRSFGRRLVPTFNYFQTAVCLHDEGQLPAAGVERVARVLIERESYSREMLENSLEDVVRRGHLDPAPANELAEKLRDVGLLPRRGVPFRRRWREWLRRRGRRAVAPPPVDGLWPEAAEVPDYVALVGAWRTER